MACEIATDATVAGDRRMRVSGDLDLATVPAFVERFDDELAAGPDRITVDLRTVSFSDTTGLAALIRCRRRAARLGVDLVLDVGEGPLAQLLDLTHLRNVFVTC
jgi:anti-anti-sigma factor